ncbi:hypothetical protein ACOMHN_042229 [Nucella lapillus]
MHCLFWCLFNAPQQGLSSTLYSRASLQRSTAGPLFNAPQQGLSSMLHSRASLQCSTAGPLFIAPQQGLSSMLYSSACSAGVYLMNSLLAGHKRLLLKDSLSDP